MHDRPHAHTSPSTFRAPTHYVLTAVNSQVFFVNSDKKKYIITAQRIMLLKTCINQQKQIFLKTYQFSVCGSNPMNLMKVPLQIGTNATPVPGHWPVWILNELQSCRRILQIQTLQMTKSKEYSSFSFKFRVLQSKFSVYMSFPN